MLVIILPSQLIHGRAVPSKRDEVKLWDEYPKCKDIKATYGSTWLPAAECAIAKLTRRIKDKVIEILERQEGSDTDEKPARLRVTLYDHDLMEKTFEYDLWWPAPIAKAVIDHQDGCWVNDEKPLNPDKEFRGFQTDNTNDWDPSIGSWKLTGKAGAVEVKGTDFDKIKAWDWISKNADRSPIVISTVRETKKLGEHQCYTVMTTKEDKDGEWLHLFDPNETKEKWYKLKDIYDDLDKIGHLAEWASI